MKGPSTLTMKKPITEIVNSPAFKKGALHKQLGVPQGKKIPADVLKEASRRKGKLGQRARFAMILRGLGK